MSCVMSDRAGLRSGAHLKVMRSPRLRVTSFAASGLLSACLMSAWSAGMLAAHCGRVVQVGLMMSSTTRAELFASSVTATGAGMAGARFGFGAAEADGGAVVAAAVVAAALVAALTGEALGTA